MSNTELILGNYASQVGGHGTDPNHPADGLLTLFDDDVICKPLPDARRGIFEVNLYRNLLIALISYGNVFLSNNDATDPTCMSKYGWTVLDFHPEWASNALYMCFRHYSHYYLSAPQLHDNRGAFSTMFQRRYGQFLHNNVHFHQSLMKRAPFDTCLYYRALFAGMHFFPTSLGCMAATMTTTPHGQPVSTPCSTQSLSDQSISVDTVQPYLLLNNLTQGFSVPAILDIKTGQRSWNSSASIKKVGYEVKKYPLQSAYGFRIVGIKMPNQRAAAETRNCPPISKYRFERDRKWGQSIDQPYQIAYAFLTLFHGIVTHPTSLSPLRTNAEIALELCRIGLEQLEMLLFWCVCYPVHRIYAASVLLIMESDYPECVRRLDLYNDAYNRHQQQQQHQQQPIRSLSGHDCCQSDASHLPTPSQLDDIKKSTSQHLPQHLFTVDDMIKYYQHDAEWSNQLHREYMSDVAINPTPACPPTQIDGEHHDVHNARHWDTPSCSARSCLNDSDADERKPATILPEEHISSTPIPPILIKIIDFAHCHPVPYDQQQYHDNIIPNITGIRSVYRQYNSYDQFPLCENAATESTGNGFPPSQSHDTLDPSCSNSTGPPARPSPFLFPAPLPPLHDAQGTASGWNISFIPVDKHHSLTSGNLQSTASHSSSTIPLVASSPMAWESMRTFARHTLSTNPHEKTPHCGDGSLIILPNFTGIQQDHSFINGIKSIIGYFIYIKFRLEAEIERETQSCAQGQQPRSSSPQLTHTEHASGNDNTIPTEHPSDRHDLVPDMSFEELYNFLKQFDPALSPESTTWPSI